MATQTFLFADDAPVVPLTASSTFIPNMSLPVHRWFRYSAGFSASWVESIIRASPRRVVIFDPFAGSGTTLLAAEAAGVESWGMEAHPFVYRVARAKLHYRTNADLYLRKIEAVLHAAETIRPELDVYPTLIRKCYSDDTLTQLDKLRRGFEKVRDDTPASELVWMTLVGILRRASSVGTAQWQYVLPSKQKRAPANAAIAFDECSRMIYYDMRQSASISGQHANLLAGDARTCEGVPPSLVNLVVTSPPYPNNYDYADATRLEMSFLREIDGWGDLQETVRKFLVRSCSQHVPESAIDLDSVLETAELKPIRNELESVCRELAGVRKTKRGRKTYHLMIACYFRDLALTWRSLRSVCASPSRTCFVIGDSAPYGVYVPVIPWLGALAVSAGFKSYSFDKTRDRNIKWKNRKHRVPLQEGHLWVEG